MEVGTRWITPNRTRHVDSPVGLRLIDRDARVDSRSGRTRTRDLGVELLQPRLVRSFAVVPLLTSLAWALLSVDDGRRHVTNAADADFRYVDVVGLPLLAGLVVDVPCAVVVSQTLGAQPTLSTLTVGVGRCAVGFDDQLCRLAAGVERVALVMDAEHS